MKGIGKGVKNFKDGVKGLEDDIKLDDNDKSKKWKNWNKMKCPFGITWKNFVGLYSVLF